MIGPTHRAAVMETVTVALPGNTQGADFGLSPSEFERQTGIAEARADVVAFCSSHGISKDVKRLADIVRQHMHGVLAIECRVETDPDSDKSWAVIEVSVKDATKLLADYDAVVREWVKSTEALARDAIKFTFSLA